MNSLKSIGILAMMVCAAAGSLYAQQPTMYQDDNMTTEAFAALLKQEWFFLRDEQDKFIQETQKKGEFETTSEFQSRTTQRKQLFLETVNKHVKENKLDQRVFGIWMKASLLNYDADQGIFTLSCPVSIEAPYDISSVQCFLPNNPFVELTDSVMNGYRSSKIQLKLHPNFKWHINREQARDAQASEVNIYFKVHFTLGFVPGGSEKQMMVRIIPKDISLIDQYKKLLYWHEVLNK